jgi:hypothetical protein
LEPVSPYSSSSSDSSDKLSISMRNLAECWIWQTISGLMREFLRMILSFARF